MRLDEEIQSEVPIELEGTDQAPGVREGWGARARHPRGHRGGAADRDPGRQITVDVSEMEIGDTISLATVIPPAGTKFMVDEPEEITIATLSPPRVEEEPEPEVEEEAELVGEGEEVPEGEEARRGRGGSGGARRGAGGEESR